MISRCATVNAEVAAKIHGLQSSSMVLERTDATYRQIDYWTKTGIVRPIVRGAGSGNAHLFDEIETRVMHVLARLSNLGIKPATLAPRVRESVIFGRPVEVVAGLTIDAALIGGA